MRLLKRGTLRCRLNAFERVTDAQEKMFVGDRANKLKADR